MMETTEETTPQNPVAPEDPPGEAMEASVSEANNDDNTAEGNDNAGGEAGEEEAAEENDSVGATEEKDNEGDEEEAGGENAKEGAEAEQEEPAEGENGEEESDSNEKLELEGEPEVGETDNDEGQGETEDGAEGAPEETTGEVAEENGNAEGDDQFLEGEVEEGDVDGAENEEGDEENGEGEEENGEEEGEEGEYDPADMVTVKQEVDEEDSDYLEEQMEKEEDPDFDPTSYKSSRDSGRPSRAAKSRAKANIKTEGEGERKRKYYTDDQHDMGPEAVACKICNKKCMNMHGLLRHINMSACKEEYGDEYEEMRWKHKGRKYNRRRRDDSDDDRPDESVSCKVCDKKCLNVHGLLRHINMTKCKRKYGSEYDEIRASLKGQRHYMKKYTDEEWNAVEDGTGNVYVCRCCQTEFRACYAILKHVTYVKKCRDVYGDDGLTELKVVVRKYRYHTKDPDKAERDRMRRFKNYYENREAKLKKGRDYYAKNREAITLKKRMRYMVDEKGQRIKGEVAGKAGPPRLTKLPIKNPDRAYGIVNLQTGDKFDTNLCLPESEELPCSKIDHDALDEDAELLTLPSGSSLTGRFVGSSELHLAESFVGMALSNDGESIEVKQLLNRQNVTLQGLQELFHSLMAVTETDMKEILYDKGSPIIVVNHKNIITYRNHFSKEIQDSGFALPAIPEKTCDPMRTRETHFISEDMTTNIPDEQLLVNPGLMPSDMAAIGLELRYESTKEVLLVPMFTVNMMEWRHNIKYFFTVLVNWIGSKELVQELVLKIPCGAYGKEMIYQDVREECYLNAIRPKTVAMCEHCGLSFEYNKYIFSEVSKYKHHVGSHNTTCRICGETFPTSNAKKYHQRTHNKEFYPCEKGDCKWIGNTTKSRETHWRLFHTSILCDLCGKEYSNQNSLSLHISMTHEKKKKPKNRNLQCRTCGRVGYSTQNELVKHELRHQKPGSNVNKWMYHRPEDYKFICPMHENCKKYFKRLSYLRHHMKVYEQKDYPENIASQYRPNIGENEKPMNVAGVTEGSKGYPVSADPVPFPTGQQEDEDDEDEEEMLKKPPKVPRFEFDQISGESRPRYSNHSYVPGGDASLMNKAYKQEPS